MSWYDDQPVVTPPAAPEPAPSRPPARGLRRGAIVAALGALLLVGGGWHGWIAWRSAPRRCSRPIRRS